MSAPTITRINPATGPTTGGIIVTITGTNLASPSTVTFGGTSATINSSSATSISVTAPAHIAGVARIVVTTAGGSTTQAANFTYVTVAAPSISSLSPTNGAASGANLVTITGTNLLYTTGVTFGTTSASFNVVSNTQVSAIAPAGTAGATTVSVTNGTGTSNTLPYTYNGLPTPVITSVSPTSGSATGGNTTVINGSGFTFTTAVTFGSTAATSFIVASDSVINAVVPPGPSAGGAVSVLVTALGGTSAAGTTYTYTATPTPTVTALAPASGPDSGGNVVTLTGSNLNGATAVTFAGNAASSSTVVSSTQINAVAPPGTAGTASVVVTTPLGATTEFDYTYIGVPAPTALFATTGVMAGGTNVAVTGSNLTGTTGVNFGTTPATSFTVVDDNEVDAISPAHLVGTVPINITTPGGTDSSLSFDFQPSPVISSITPTSGPITGGTVVTITGSGLFNIDTVNFGTTPATFTIVSDTTVTATSPAEAAGASGVSASIGSATSNAPTFLFIDAPTLASLNPTGGAIAGGTSVTLTGTGFVSATNVFFGPNLADFTNTGDTLITAVTPNGSGAVPVTVTNAGGTSGAQTYTYS